MDILETLVLVSRTLVHSWFKNGYAKPNKKKAPISPIMGKKKRRAPEPPTANPPEPAPETSTQPPPELPAEPSTPQPPEPPAEPSTPYPPEPAADYEGYDAPPVPPKPFFHSFFFLVHVWFNQKESFLQGRARIHRTHRSRESLCGIQKRTYKVSRGKSKERKC